MGTMADNNNNNDDEDFGTWEACRPEDAEEERAFVIRIRAAREAAVARAVARGRRAAQQARQQVQRQQQQQQQQQIGQSTAHTIPYEKNELDDNKKEQNE